MSDLAESPAGDAPDHATLEPNVRYVGLVTRAISWVIDAVLINAVAIGAGLGFGLVASLFHIPNEVKTVLEAAAATLYVVWAAAYFVGFWSITGQTPGSRVMQVRLVTPGGKRLKPGRAFVRWVGMNLAAIPLFAGFVPIVFDDQRRGFADWLAHTRVIEAPQMSLAETRRAAVQAARERAEP
jgi:uncharacterized RDD family membrane protein YckC